MSKKFVEVIVLPDSALRIKADELHRKLFSVISEFKKENIDMDVYEMFTACSEATGRIFVGSMREPTVKKGCKEAIRFIKLLSKVMEIDREGEV